MKTLDLDVFRANNRAAPKCKLLPWLLSRTPREQRIIAEAFHDPSIQATAILKVLNQYGLAVSESVVLRTRRGRCAACNAWLKKVKP